LFVYIVLYFIFISKFHFINSSMLLYLWCFIKAWHNMNANLQTFECGLGSPYLVCAERGPGGLPPRCGRVYVVSLVG